MPYPAEINLYPQGVGLYPGFGVQGVSDPNPPPPARRKHYHIIRRAGRIIRVVR